MKKMILASTSTVYGSGYLEYLLPELAVFFKDVEEILFIPYARAGGKTYEEYTIIVKEAFQKIEKKVVGIQEFNNAKDAVKKSKAIFTGGGNTFVLLKQLYKEGLIEVLKEEIEKGTLYLGTSAGSNICGQTIKTTNDMPIVCPVSFDALGLVPFNLNPHYLDPDPSSTHMGETRETRIKEYFVYNDTAVVGLREGSWLKIENVNINLCGQQTVRMFEKGKPPFETNSVL